ncbi:MAG: ShlB/FhaC/HecB family hemolysin secretion/activation protein [Sphingobium sp.]|nr:ShlB/FhaC/HecB family hemolysin secretion/activation protein [Sphingobium sp.]MBP8670512.1 ShlB/FhaC/HecB family hemolysin secretion/activation protein [Sphingobium sp.]
MHQGRARIFHAGAAWAAGALLSCIPSASAQDNAGTQPQVRAAPNSFFIAAFDVLGAKSLDQSVIEQVIYDHLGPDRTTADVEAARKAIQDAYAVRGFESVQVDVLPQPEEQFTQGIIAIQVTEAPVGTVAVTGAKHHSMTLVRKQIPSLAEGKPLNVKQLQTELASANQFPDRTINPSFKAGATPGTIDVDLDVEDSLPLHGSLELNNDNSPSTKPLRLNASLRYTNMWGLGHTISGSYITAPQDRKQSEVFSGSYTAPLLGSRWTMLLYGYKSNSNVAAQGGVSVLGNGYQIGTRAIYRLPGDKLIQSVTLGFDYKHFDQDTRVAGQIAAKTPIEYLPLYAAYGLSTGGDKSTLDITVSATAGFRVFKNIRCFDVGTTTCIPTDQFKNKDFDSSENFVRGNIEVDYRRTLPKDFVAALKFYGQIADSHLVTNEQFAIGGLGTVRGYYSAESVGDMGYALSLELNSPSLAPYLPKFIDELRLFGFAENGQIRLIDPLPDVTRHEALLSVGGGARLRLFNRISGEVSVGLPLWNGSATRKNDVRTTFTAKGEF